MMFFAENEKETLENKNKKNNDGATTTTTTTVVSDDEDESTGARVDTPQKKVLSLKDTWKHAVEQTCARLCSWADEHAQQIYPAVAVTTYMAYVHMRLRAIEQCGC